MDAGFDSIDKVSRTRLVNMLPTINKNMNIYNGTAQSLLQINPWNKDVSFENATSGF